MQPIRPLRPSMQGSEQRATPLFCTAGLASNSYPINVRWMLGWWWWWRDAEWHPFCRSYAARLLRGVNT